MRTVTRIIGRVREIWAEVDYAQRRMLEIQTGLPVKPARNARRSSASIKQLETLLRS